MSDDNPKPSEKWQTQKSSLTRDRIVIAALECIIEFGYESTTMSKIAKRFGVTVEQLLLANPQVKDPNKIAIGDGLTIPVPELDGVPDAGDASTTP